MFFIVLTIRALGTSITYSEEISPDYWDPSKSPLDLTIAAGFGIMMIEWPDAILSISYGDVSKKLSHLDGYTAFTFDKDAKITMTFRKKVLFSIFKVPEKEERNSVVYVTNQQNEQIATVDYVNYDFFFNAYGKYNVNSKFYCKAETTIYYNKDGEYYSKSYNPTQFEYKTDSLIQKTFGAKSSDQLSFTVMHLDGIKELSPTIPGYVCIKTFGHSDMSRAYLIDLGRPDGDDSAISYITPKTLYKIKLDTTDYENDKYTFKYRYTKTDPYTSINQLLTLESAEKFSIYVYVSSPLYSQCKDKEYKMTVNSEQNDNVKKLVFNQFPSECKSPKATLYYTNNITVDLDLYTSHTLNSYSRFEKGIEKIREEETSFSLRFVAKSDYYCQYELIKQVDVEVGQTKYIVINDEDIPKNCKISDTTTVCICQEEDYDKCSEDVEGRVIKYTKDTIESDFTTDYNIRIFRDLTVTPSIFRRHKITVADGYQLIMKYKFGSTINVAATDDDELQIDNLIFDNSSISNILLTGSGIKMIYVPSTKTVFDTLTIKNQGLWGITVPDNNIENAIYSPLKFTGGGKVNLRNYPIDKVTANADVSLYNGIYVVCNIDAAESNCPVGEYEVFNILSRSSTFDGIPPNSNVFIFPNTYQGYLDIDIKKINNHKIEIIDDYMSSQKLLDSNGKVRILSTEQLSQSKDLLSIGDEKLRFSIRKQETNDFTFQFNDMLTFRQTDGGPDYSYNSINIQPTKPKFTFYFDDSFKQTTQMYNLLCDEISEISAITVYTENGELSEYTLRNMIQTTMDTYNKYTINKGKPPSSNPEEPGGNNDNNNPNGDNNNDKKSKGLSGGAIAGIVIAVIVVIAAVAVGVFFFIKKKKQNDQSANEDQVEL